MKTLCYKGTTKTLLSTYLKSDNDGDDLTDLH